MSMPGTSASMGKQRASQQNNRLAPDECLAKLDDPDWRVRLQIMTQCDPDLLLQHGDKVVVAKLKDPHELVRMKAVQMFEKLDLEHKGNYSHLLLERITDDSDRSVAAAAESAAKKILYADDLQQWAQRKLERAGVSVSWEDKLAKLDDPNWQVRLQWMKYMFMPNGMMKGLNPNPDMLLKNADKVASKLNDPHEEVRALALEVMFHLRAFHPAKVAEYAESIAARIDDSDHKVQAMAIGVLDHLEPLVKLNYAKRVAAKLNDPHDWVRGAAVAMIGNLDPATMAKYADSLAERLEDSD